MRDVRDNAAPSARVVRKRQIFYLSGYDPRGAVFYHRLYQEEAAQQALLHKAKITVGPRVGKIKPVDCWHIEADWAGQHVATDYYFLGWDDIIRRDWQANPFKLFLSSVGNAFHYVRCGAFAALWKHYSGPLVSAVYPWLYLSLLLASSAFWAWLIVTVMPSVIPKLMSLAVAGLVAAAWLKQGIKLANQWGVLWLLRDYLFVIQMGRNDSKIMRERIEVFVQAIHELQQADSTDEIIIVGHSLGSVMAVHLAARYAEQYPELAVRIKLVTLGQCIPFLSGIPEAKLFNRHLSYLQNQKLMEWGDYLAKADGLAFCNESELSHPSTPYPRTHIVRFFNMFSPKKYARLKRNKLQLHFQYLKATEQLGEYDYFAMTAGPAPLIINFKN